MTSQIPTKPSGGNGRVFIGLAVAMLVTTGALIAWKVTRSTPSESATPVPTIVEDVPRRDNAPPPPPPPPPAEEVSAVPSAQSVSNGALRPAKSPCSGECKGEVTGALRSALAGRGGAGRRCYEKSLAQNATLSGKMTVHVKVSPQGSVCAASVANDTLQDPGLSNCILGVFRSSTLPAPQGGCVDVDVPLSFVPSK